MSLRPLNVIASDIKRLFLNISPRCSRYLAFFENTIAPIDRRTFSNNGPSTFEALILFHEYSFYWDEYEQDATVQAIKREIRQHIYTRHPLESLRQYNRKQANREDTISNDEHRNDRTAKYLKDTARDFGRRNYK